MGRDGDFPSPIKRAGNSRIQEEGAPPNTQFIENMGKLQLACKLLSSMHERTDFFDPPRYVN